MAKWEGASEPLVNVNVLPCWPYRGLCYASNSNFWWQKLQHWLGEKRMFFLWHWFLSVPEQPFVEGRVVEVGVRDREEDCPGVDYMQNASVTPKRHSSLWSGQN